jgi:hypothetical protein
METMLAVLLALQAVPTEPLVRKGIVYLKSRAEELRKDPEFGLWVLTSLDVPADRRLHDDPVVRGLLDDALARAPESTRSAALQAMTLERLDPVRFRTRIAHCGQFLIDNQCDDGRWDGGKPTDPPPLPATAIPPLKPGLRAFAPPGVQALPKVVLARRAAGAKSGDSVNSRWAAWGLLACHQSGIAIPLETVLKAAASWRDGEHDPADVVAALSIHLYLSRKDWTKDPDILIAVHRLDIRDPRTDPASLFLLKRAMLHFGSEKLGDRDWCQDGVRVLAASQAPDGGWGSVEDTCFAALFLHVPRR